MENTAIKARGLFGEFISSARKKKNLTQAEVAAKAGIASSHLCYIEQGKREPTLNVAIRICEILNINIADYIANYL